MNYAHAIIIAAGIVAAAVIFTQNTNADILGGGGRYQLSSGDATSAWRLDTETGQMAFCSWVASVTCWAEKGVVQAD